MKVCAFNFAVSIFSPVRLAGEGQMKHLLGLEKIPARLHPLLKQPVIPSEAVAPFEKHKKRARDFLLKNGTRHELLNWVTSPEKRDFVISKMTEIQNDFYNEKAQFLAGYPATCEAHLQAIAEECAKEGFDRCGDLVEIIRAAQPTVEYLDSQIHFKFLKPKLVELDPDEEAEVQEGIYWQALYDLAARAKGAVKATMPTTQIRAAKEIIEKLESLVYLDNRYERVANELAEAIKDIPVIRNEDYTTSQRLQLTGIFSMMLDAKELDGRIKSGAGLFPRPSEPTPPASSEGGGGEKESAPAETDLFTDNEESAAPEEDVGSDDDSGGDGVTANPLPAEASQTPVYAW